jgi:hypothetical protein
MEKQYGLPPQLDQPITVGELIEPVMMPPVNLPDSYL